jgi:hypothetical protein
MQRAQWILGALALLLVIALGLLLAGRFAPPPRSTPTETPVPAGASVAALQGAVFACPTVPNGECATPASPGQQVFVGGEVRTGASGTADVQTRTTVFRLENGTQVRFRAVSDAVTQVVLALGRLFTSHDPGGHSVVRVQAGQVTIQAIDTRFSVATTANGGVYVAVPRGGGAVTILMGLAASVPLGDGQEITINPNGGNAPGLAPQPISPAEQARWAVVSCEWQRLAARLTPVALPPAQCATPTASPVVPPSATPARPSPTPPPPTATPVVETPTPTPAGAALATAGGTTLATATPTLPPGRTVAAYVATWLNTDRLTTGPPKLVMTNKATTLIVQWFKFCAPHLCAAGTSDATLTRDSFTILSPEQQKMRLTLDQNGTRLTLDDGGDGPRYSFRRIAARDYNGTWLNDDPADLTLPQLVISNSSNKITVDWSSGCFVADCTSTGPFSPEPIVTDRFSLSFDNVTGSALQVDDLIQSTTYYFHHK